MVIPAAGGDRLAKADILSHPSPSYATLSDPRLSPRFASPGKFPDGGRTMVLSVEYDYLAEDGKEVGRVLEEAGREPVRVWIEDVGHGWDILCSDGTEEAKVRDEMWSKAVGVIKRAQKSTV
ncbi:hypothetical protein CALVIDRAFT_244514 [Calocera viscosa TUFC12733]|uniref:Alpha/beta hydrolase fold-3 domain-containing protein n=1 Tax=Calocera viscosa (strain TUFC12733) TaxID=1330018 RepID=A0A167JGK7_CALVF|nr:hypothetical protein CALVIDRAFT_244514 [Calocera viscosa TUFC12733]